jgi:diadenosine tetraphosphate (Ap4A) HIT family hydrolase
MPTLFSKIIAGEIPSSKVASGDKWYAFLDINPRRAGHTLVVPKEEKQRIADLSSESRASLLDGVAEAQRRLTAVFDTTDFLVAVHDGPLAGQEGRRTHSCHLDRTLSLLSDHMPCAWQFPMCTSTSFHGRLAMVAEPSPPVSPTRHLSAPSSLTSRRSRSCRRSCRQLSSSSADLPLIDVVLVAPAPPKRGAALVCRHKEHTLRDILTAGHSTLCARVKIVGGSDCVSRLTPARHHARDASARPWPCHAGSLPQWAPVARSSDPTRAPHTAMQWYNVIEMPHRKKYTLCVRNT